jgi:poly-D-alanine transfer protein DltD
MKKEVKKTKKKLVVSKEKYDKLVAENGKLVASNDKLEFNNAYLEKALCNHRKTSMCLSNELLRLERLIENNNKKWFSRKIKL